MSDLINFLTSKEIIMVYIVAAVACILYFIIHVIDKFYYQKRKQKQNTKELNRLVEDINYELAKEREEELSSGEVVEEISEEEPIYIEPVLERIDEEEIIEVAHIEEPSVIEVIEQPIEVIEQIEMSQVEPEVVEEIIEEVETNAVNNQQIEEINVEEETLDYTSAEPNQTEAQAELRRLTEALEQAEETTKNIDLTSYEEMQEKEAIISLEELMKRSKEMYESNELTQYADEGNEPISLEDLERKVKESLEIEEVEVNNEPVIEQIEFTEVLESTQPEIIAAVEQEKMAMDDFYSVKTTEVKKSTTAYQQYKSMPIISPIYGIEKKVSTSSLELENTANYEKLDEEIKKTNEFIMSLKELQENLD